MVRESNYLRENRNAMRLLRRMERFKGFSEKDLRSFLDVGKLRQYEAGEVLIREGGSDGWIYLLIDGKVEIIKSGQIINTLHRSGELFGEMEAVDGDPRSATIRAVTDTLVLGIDGFLPEQKMQTRDMAFCCTLYRLFAEILSERLRTAIEEISDLRQQLQQVKKDPAGAKPLPESKKTEFFID